MGGLHSNRTFCESKLTLFFLYFDARLIVLLRVQVTVAVSIFEAVHEHQELPRPNAEQSAYWSV